MQGNLQKVIAVAVSNIDVTPSNKLLPVVDGITIFNNQFVLLTRQTDPTMNGVYQVRGNQLQRGNPPGSGDLVCVLGGLTFNGSIWVPSGFVYDLVGYISGMYTRSFPIDHTMPLATGIPLWTPYKGEMVFAATQTCSVTWVASGSTPEFDFAYLSGSSYISLGPHLCVLVIPNGADPSLGGGFTGGDNSLSNVGLSQFVAPGNVPLGLRAFGDGSGGPTTITDGAGVLTAFCLDTNI